jgi:hypothetical protein
MVREKPASRDQIPARRKHYLARLERYPQAQLNLSCVVWIEGAGDFAEGTSVGHKAIYITQVAVIENVEKVKAELQVALFPEPG